MPTLSNNWLSSSAWRPDLFKGKVVFCTGGAGSICKVQVEAMVLLGANAAILGRRQEATEKAANDIQSLRSGSKVIGLGGVDVRDVKSLKKAVDETVRQLGRIDYVIAGAAGNFLSDINHLSANGFKTVIDIDLLGSYNTLKACRDELVKNKGGMLFVSATLHYYGLNLQAHASAAKAGVDALSRVVAVELGPLGVRSNVIAPGPIEGTEGMDRLSGGKQDNAILSSIPLQRMGTTADIANGTVFLFSDASSYITGTALVVDGGSWQTGNSQSTIEGYPTFIVHQHREPSKL